MFEELEPREEDRVTSLKSFSGKGHHPWYTNIKSVHLIRGAKKGTYEVLDYRKTYSTRLLSLSEKAFLMLKGELG